jgi:3-oxoacyl-[acyl-carrier protein] reductase
MVSRLDGKSALVTGSSRGIGTAIAARLAADGAAVIVCGRDEVAAANVMGEIVAQGGSGFSVVLDVSDEKSVEDAFSIVRERVGKLDILVNNAGIAPRIHGQKGTVEETSLSVWQDTLNTNLIGTFLCSRAAIPLIKAAGGGRIINMTSQAGRMYTGFGSGHYSASKAGIIGLTRVLAGELGPFGITANCVSPSRTASDLLYSFANAAEIEARYVSRTPIGRIAQPEEVAAAVAYLASSDAAYVTGTIIDVTGGFYMP